MTDLDGLLVAAGGWCAPSDTIYSIFDPNRPLPLAWCPEWIAVDEPDSDCCYHDCPDEFRGDHTVCVCSDCGATRIVTKETTV